MTPAPSRSLNTAKRARVALAISAAALLVFAAVCWFAVGALRPRARLPDGTVLVLERVTYGAEHRHVTGPGVLPLLAPALPPELAKRLGVTEAKVSEANLMSGSRVGLPKLPHDFLVFWIRRSAPRNPGRPRNFSGTGFSFHPSRPEVPIGSVRRLFPVPGSLDLEAWVVTSWDRRASHVGFARIFPQLKQPVRLVLPNPAQLDASRPEAPAPPVKARDREVEVTLRALAGGVKFPSMPNRPRSGGMGAAVVDARDTRRADRTWVPGQFDITDATGNWVASHPEHFATRNQGTQSLALFPTELPLEEPWKLRVELVQSGGYSREQLWKVGPIPLPLRSQVERLKPVPPFVRSGYRVLGISGQNVGRTFGIYPPDGNPALFVQAPDRAAAMALVAAIDQSGRPVNFRSTTARGNVRAFSLLPGQDVRSVNLTLALQERRVVTLTARPTVGTFPRDFSRRRQR